jgi:hypothetical protein
MKGITALLVFLLVVIFAAGCAQSPPPPSQAEQILRGEHLLRKITERTDINSVISGSFFLFVGNLNSTTKTTIAVKFAWKMNDGIYYALSSLPLEKIRVKFDEKAITPTIKFRWRPWNGNGTAQIQDLMENYVLYAVITAREKDWPIQVNLPLNQ